MDDVRIVEFERELWVGEGDVYRRSVSPDCLMVVPEQPFLLRGDEAVTTVEGTPRWTDVEFFEFEIKRPQEGIIVVGYRVDASRGEERYSAYCTSTYQRLGEHEWRVIQHQQTPHVTGSLKQRGSTPEQVQEEAAEERESSRGYQ
jgi:hypothetical protein